MAEGFPIIDLNVTDKVVEFLKESSEFYCDSVQALVDADEMAGGNFWTEERIKEWKRGKRKCEHLSQWDVFGCAITSPLTKSPWHSQLEDQNTYQTIQDTINTIESDSDAKNAFIDCFERCAKIGANYIVITTIADEWTGEAKIVPECVEDVASVALDPMVTTASARDAEQGAIVNWISEIKARRLYGNDVVPMNYPQTLPRLYEIGEQWKSHPSKSIPIVSYYEKNENGFVTMYKLCGDKVVEKTELPTRIIPIIRFAGYKVRKNKRTRYIGIIDKTYSLQLGLNIAYSTMLERSNRTPKANWMMPVKAMDGLEEYYQRANEDDSLAILYNGDAGVPVQLRESFETGDLQNVINTTQQLMAAVLGIPPTGIQGIGTSVYVERTATEVFEQAANRESNVASLYNHAYEAMRAIWMCVIEMLNGGKRIKFSLQSGPDVITSNMKRRQELQVMSALLPEQMRVILAKYYAETLTTDDAKSLAQDIVANLDPTIKLVSDQELDAYAIHEIKQMHMVAQQAMDELETTKQENADLKRQLDSLFAEMANQREQRQLDWNKTLLEQQNKQAQLELEAAKAGAQNAVNTQKLELEAQKVAIDAQNAMEATINESNAMIDGGL